MSNNSHTPGPWELVNSYGIYSALGADSGDGVKADNDDGWHIANIGDCPTCVDGVGIDLGYSVQTANAHLITAAPDLLESLIITVGAIREICHVRDIPLPMSTLNRAEAAIAKAKGEDQ